MWSYIVNLFHRSLNNHPLSPRERAFIKSMQGMLIGVAVDAAPQLYQVALGHAKFNISNAVVAALIGALLAYVLKLFQAQGDSNLSALLDAYAKAKEREALGGLTVPSADGSVSVPALQLMLPLVHALAVESSINVTSAANPTLAQPSSTLVPSSAPNQTVLNPSLSALSTADYGAQTVAMPAVSSFPLPGASGIHVADLPTANVPAVNPDSHV